MRSRTINASLSITINRGYFFLDFIKLKILKITQRCHQKTSKNWGTYDSLLVIFNRRDLKECVAVAIIDESNLNSIKGKLVIA
jgi:hypothetical protein